jgi:hypothetical protein
MDNSIAGARIDRVKGGCFYLLYVIDLRGVNFYGFSTFFGAYNAKDDYSQYCVRYADD